MSDHQTLDQEARAEVVRRFWNEVWTDGRFGLIPDFISEDFVIHSGGKDITPRAAFVDWVRAFQSAIVDLEFKIEDLFIAGDKVTTRWRIIGRNNGFMSTPQNDKPIDLTGITISRVGDDGLIHEKWVERSAWELFPNIQ